MVPPVHFPTGEHSPDAEPPSPDSTSNGSQLTPQTVLSVYQIVAESADDIEMTVHPIGNDGTKRVLGRCRHKFNADQPAAEVAEGSIHGAVSPESRCRQQLRA